MKKGVLTSLFFLTCFLGCFGQKVDFMARGNFSIGGEYETLDYGGGDLLYSPGGGIGVELGVQIELLKNLSLQSALGYQLQLAILSESFNGDSNESSFFFNRKFVSLGILKKIPLTEDIFNSFILGVGIHYNNPGSLTRTENNSDLGTSEYSSALGHYFELGLRLKVSEKVFLDPGLRIRRLQLDAASYSQGPITNLPVHLQNVNANGVELGLTLIKEI